MRLLLELLLLLLLLGLCNADHGDGRGFSDLVPRDLGSGEEVSDDAEDMTTIILRMNNGSSELLLEGDLVIPRTRSARKCLKRPQKCLWPRQGRNVVIPYVLSDGYDYSERSEIVNAMKDLESETCLRFVPHSGQRGYLSIESRHGCSSKVGYMGGKQTVSLQKHGCLIVGIIQHELMHALGFHHEHNRSDRDQYIRIHWDNIKGYFKNNFEKRDTNNLGTSYDYSSVMHYGKTAFGMSGSETMTPIPNPNVPIGQRTRASALDFVRINRLYCGGYRG